MFDLNKLKQFYLNSPLWIKKIYSAIPFEWRNGREYRKWIQTLSTSLNEPEYELLKLKETIFFAYNEVPYYKNLFDTLRIKPEDINISISGDTLTLRGEIKEDEDYKNDNYHIKEMRQGTFSRTMTLPVKVDAEKAKADFENGVLRLTMPKAEEVKPKTITVKAK